MTTYGCDPSELDFALSISESYQESLLLKAKQKQLEDDRRMAEFLASENLTFAEDDNANWSSHTPLFTIVRPPVFESSASSDTDTDTDIEQFHEEENQKQTPKKRKSSAGKRNKAAPSIKAERKQKQKEYKERKERKENLKSKGKGTKRKLSQKARDEIEGHLGHCGGPLKKLFTETWYAKCLKKQQEYDAKHGHATNDVLVVDMRRETVAALPRPKPTPAPKPTNSDALGRPIAASALPQAKETERPDCPVCMSPISDEDFKNSDSLLPCLHHFHPKCLARWEKQKLKETPRRTFYVCMTCNFEYKINDDGDRSPH